MCLLRAILTLTLITTVLTTLAPAGCSYLASNWAKCVFQGALVSISRSPFTITTKKLTTEVIGKLLEYSMKKWPILETVYGDLGSYTCHEGLCILSERYEKGIPSLTTTSTHRIPTNAHIGKNAVLDILQGLRPGLSDVSIVLITFSVVFVAACFLCVMICCKITNTARQRWEKTTKWWQDKFAKNPPLSVTDLENQTQEKRLKSGGRVRQWLVAHKLCKETELETNNPIYYNIHEVRGEEQMIEPSKLMLPVPYENIDIKNSQVIKTTAEVYCQAPPQTDSSVSCESMGDINESHKSLYTEKYETNPQTIVKAFLRGTHEELSDEASPKFHSPLSSPLSSPLNPMNTPYGLRRTTLTPRHLFGYGWGDEEGAVGGVDFEYKQRRKKKMSKYRKELFGGFGGFDDYENEFGKDEIETRLDNIRKKEEGESEDAKIEAREEEDSRSETGKDVNDKIVDKNDQIVDKDEEILSAEQDTGVNEEIATGEQGANALNEEISMEERASNSY